MITALLTEVSKLPESPKIAFQFQDPLHRNRLPILPRLGVDLTTVIERHNRPVVKPGALADKEVHLLSQAMRR